ncbi:MAG: lysophospholipid acyltransferase family protein [Anaerolineae bacterium]
MGKYPIPPSFALPALWSVLRGQRRSLSADAARLLAGASPPPQIENPQHIPPEGPLIVVANHYCRPGLGVWWSALLISHAVAQRGEVRWVMTSEWIYPDPLRRWLVTPATRWLFARIARAYGLVSMPPMPPDPRRMHERARAVRQAVALVAPGKSRRWEIIGLRPEGRESGDGCLIEPPPGVGRFLLLLTRAGMPILPVGVFEREGVLTASFGEPFRLAAQPGLSKGEQDQRVRDRVMVAIGELLPPRLWGVYKDRVSLRRRRQPFSPAERR